MVLAFSHSLDKVCDHKQLRNPHSTLALMGLASRNSHGILPPQPKASGSAQTRQSLAALLKPMGTHSEGIFPAFPKNSEWNPIPTIHTFLAKAREPHNPYSGTHWLTDPGGKGNWPESHRTVLEGHHTPDTAQRALKHNPSLPVKKPYLISM